MRLSIILTMLSAMSLAFSACDKLMDSKALSSIAKTAKIESKPIPTVKKGHLAGCPDFTVEEMFRGSDNDTGIFRDEKPKWEHRVGENGIDYVNVSHYEMVDGKPAKVSVLFWVKNGAFGIQAFKKDEDVIDASEQLVGAFVKTGCAAALAHRASDSAALADRPKDSLPHNAFRDPRNGKVYTMLSIGGHTWMAENLNFATEGSMCYNNDDSYCAKYGRLYGWNEARAACPAGWRLPNNEEWSDLVLAAGSRATAGKKLKSKEGWNSHGNGTDAFGFAALPGGTFGANPSGGSATFAANGTSGRFWSATEHRDGGAYYVAMHNSDDAVVVGNERSYGFSVRCIREEAMETIPTPIAQQQPATPQSATATPAPTPTRSTPTSTPKPTPKPTQAPPPPATVRTVATDPQQWAQVDVFTDSRDGQAYKTVKIGGQTWMAKNLNYRTANSVCYKNDNSYCDKYGRLYDLDDAMGACPAGWHLPTDDDWGTLLGTTYCPDCGESGAKLMSKNGWGNDYFRDYGTDDYGFSALPGGIRNADGFGHGGNGGCGAWWANGWESYGNIRRGTIMSLCSGSDYGDNASRMGSQNPSDGNSVRCVQN